jgi:hypothetical protein
MNLNADFSIPKSIISACLLKITDGFLFEEFAKNLFNQSQGTSFVPVGGIHDGGQDSFVYQSGDKRIIYQFSIRKDWKTKINQTIERLKNNPDLRDIQFTLLYFTNIEIEQSDIDKFQLKKLKEDSFNCIVQNNLKIQLEVNSVRETRNIFIDFCVKHAVFAEIENQVTDVYGGSGFDKTLLYLKHFLKEEVDFDYLEMLVKTHLYIFLSDTDPLEKKFKKYEEIIAYVCNQLPNLGKEFVSETVQNILKKIEKKHRDDREVRNHNHDGFCLAYSKRIEMQKHISDDSILLVHFENELEASIANSSSSLIKEIPSQRIKQTIRDILTEVFKSQGLEISSAIKSPSSSYHSANLKEITQSIISKKMQDIKSSGKLIIPIFEIVYSIIWRPSDIQKEFCKSLAKTFSLLFLGKADAQVVKHLKQSASGLKLLLGTDIIIKMLAEIHLPKELQRFTNLIRSLKDSGVTLIVNESTVKETAAHIRGTVLWYDVNIKPFLLESQTDEILREVLEFEERFSTKILVRAFYHAKMDKKFDTFDKFIDHFVGPNQALYNKDILDYLKAEFGVTPLGLKFSDEDPDYQYVLSELKKADAKGEQSHSRTKILENDAKVIVSTYKLRESNQIVSGADFILPAKVWWLTFESKTQRLKPLLEERFDSLPNVSPVVVISLLSNLNNLASKSDVFESILGSAIGINMSHSVPDKLVDALTTSYEAIKGLNKGKKAQMMRRIFDDLQSGHFDNITGVFDDYFSEVKKNWQVVEKIHNRAVSHKLSPSQIWKDISEIESNPVKKVIIFKEVAQESFPKTLSVLRENNLITEVNAFLQTIEQESLSKYNL